MPGVEVWRHSQQESWRSFIRYIEHARRTRCPIDADPSAWSRQGRSCRGLNLPKRFQPSEVIAKLAHEQIDLTPRIRRMRISSHVYNDEPYPSGSGRLAG
jgi:hypothetical protein